MRRRGWNLAWIVSRDEGVRFRFRRLRLHLWVDDAYSGGWRKP